MSQSPGILARRVFLLAVMLTVRAFSQTGSLRIEVHDVSGGAVEASGRLEDSAAGVQTSFATNAQGTATVPDLRYGAYRITVSKDGFAPLTTLVQIDSAVVSQTLTLQVGNAGFAVDVVSGTALPGVELERYQVPGPVQSASAADIQNSFSLNMADFFNRRLNAVFINEIQGNPFQPDVSYRGYTASPLLGTPQGISVYMDGVRLNQPFGDVVSWDLIPRIAVSETTMMPGSNPVFGLNTLGGAMSLTTKDGYSAPGTTLNLGGGSFGRKMAEMEHGGHRGAWNYYGATSLFFEDGWRQNSPSNVRQYFGRVGWQGTKTTISTSFSYANNLLVGNGLQEKTLLERDYTSLYTKPDVTGHRSPFGVVSARHAPTANLTLSGNAYYRHIRTGTLNADINEEALEESLYQPNANERAALARAGFTGVPAAGENSANTAFPKWRCIANVLLRDEPAEKCNALINRSSSKLVNYGVSGQMSWNARWANNRNRFTAGGGYDKNRSDFEQSSEVGYLNPDRSVTGLAAFGDGETGGEVNGEPFDVRVDLLGRTSTGSVFVMDTLSVGSKLNITAAGRFNRTTVDNFDRINPEEGTGSLTGKHQFQRFNPSAGLTYTFHQAANAYFNFAEASRAPTSIELGCADPASPCRLPNALAGDPPLKQVVARTFEAGLRGRTESRLNWSAGWFRSDNRNDILFVASPQTSFGYFKNFGETRRQGAEFDGSVQLKMVTIGGGYTLLDATFQSAERVLGESNSSNEEAEDEHPGLEGPIEIHPGNRIPLVPRHMAKAYADIRPTSKLLVNVGFNAFSSSFARGNENGEHEEDGTYYLGEGTSPGYAVVNLGLRYQIHPKVEFWTQVNNFLDRRYYSGAQLGPAGFLPNGNFQSRPFPAVNGEFPLRHSTFFAPGAPRGAWAGLRFRF